MAATPTTGCSARFATKLGGLRHVYEYVFHYHSMSPEEALEKIHIRQPFQNATCMHCHSTDVPIWNAVREHASLLPRLRDGSVSCASAGCHGPRAPVQQGGGAMTLLRISCVLTLVGLALMAWSMIQPTWMPVMLAMSLGQLVGTAAFAIFLFAISCARFAAACASRRREALRGDVHVAGKRGRARRSAGPHRERARDDDVAGRAGPRSRRTRRSRPASPSRRWSGPAAAAT